MAHSLIVFLTLFVAIDAGILHDMIDRLNQLDTKKVIDFVHNCTQKVQTLNFDITEITKQGYDFITKSNNPLMNLTFVVALLYLGMMIIIYLIRAIYLIFIGAIMCIIFSVLYTMYFILFYPELF